MISSILKQSFEVLTGSAGEFKDFKEKLFNINVLNATLKLQLIISQNVSEPDLIQFIRRALPLELFSKVIQKNQIDSKFVAIVLEL